MVHNKLYRHQYHSMFFSKEGVGAKSCVDHWLGFSIFMFYYICKTHVAMKSFLQPSLVALPCIWELSLCCLRKITEHPNLQNTK